MQRHLPAPSRAARLNALAAALVVTLAMLSGIDRLAGSDNAPLWAGAGSASQRA